MRSVAGGDWSVASFRNGDNDPLPPGSLGGAYPWWSLAIFALCVYVIHGILGYGEEESAPRT